MHHRPLILLALAAAALASCHQRQLPATNQPAAAEAVATETREYWVAQYTATVNGLNASGQIRIAKDSLLWINAVKVVELGRALASPDSVWFSSPTFGQRFSGSYADVEKIARMPISFEQLQAMALSNDGGEQLTQLATQLGLQATIRITKRTPASHMSFPFQKPQN